MQGACATTPTTTTTSTAARAPSLKNPYFPGEWYGDKIPPAESEQPLPPTDAPLSKIKEEMKKEPISTTEKNYSTSSTKNRKWIIIAGGVVGVILISILGTVLLSIPSPSETPAPDNTATQPEWRTFNLSVGDNRYPITYKITSGSAESMILSGENQQLRVTLDSTSNGTLALGLPREIIDSKIAEGEDADFAAFINNAEYEQPGEIEPEAGDIRTILIGFPPGTEQIDVIGTTTPATNT